MKVLVAGGSGFIGSHIVKRLESAGHDVIVFDIRGSPSLDARDFELVRRYVMDCDIVFHLAASPAHRLSVNNPYKVVENNNRALETFAEACREFKKNLIYASSFAVYHSNKMPFSEDLSLETMNAGTPYAVSKMYCESLLKNYFDLFKAYSVIVIRPSNVWGPEEHLHQPLQVLPLWVDAAKNGGEIVVYGRDTSRDFTYIDDFVDGWMAAFDFMLKGDDKNFFEIFNLAGGKEVKLLDVANLLTNKFSARVSVKEIPDFEVVRWGGDLKKSGRILGYSPKHEFWATFENHIKN